MRGGGEDRALVPLSAYALSKAERHAGTLIVDDPDATRTIEKAPLLLQYRMLQLLFRADNAALEYLFDEYAKPKEWLVRGRWANSSADMRSTGMLFFCWPSALSPPEYNTYEKHRGCKEAGQLNPVAYFLGHCWL